MGQNNFTTNTWKIKKVTFYGLSQITFGRTNFNHLYSPIILGQSHDLQSSIWHLIPAVIRLFSYNCGFLSKYCNLFLFFKFHFTWIELKLTFASKGENLVSTESYLLRGWIKSVQFRKTNEITRITTVGAYAKTFFLLYFRYHSVKDHYRCVKKKVRPS